MRKSFYHRLTTFLFILLLEGVSVCSMLHAQEHLDRSMLILSNVNTNQGLSSARVYSIIQAEDGAMWIGTKRGVDRYNGLVMRNYSLATDRLYSDASGGRNIKLLQTQNHQILAYDNKGKLYIYNKVEDAFLLTCDLQEKLGGSLGVNEIVMDAKGNFWIAMDRGLYVLPALPVASMDKNSLPVQIRGKLIFKNTYINHIRLVGQYLLIGTPTEAYIYSPQTHQKKLIVKDCSVQSSFYDAKAHQLWMGTFHKGIRIVDDRNWHALPVPSSLQGIPQIPIRSIISYNSQILLLAIDGAGVYAYDKHSQQTWLLLNTDGRQDNALHGNGVYVLCRDRLGDIWIGSYSGGVDLAIPMEHSLEYVRHEYLNRQSIIDNNVNDICQSRDGKIYYATDKGVSIYDEHTHLWSHGLFDKVALTVCQMQDGRVLVGTYGNGVYQVRPDGSAVQVYSLANGKLKSDYVYSIFSDTNGDLWIGCLDGDMMHVSLANQVASAGNKSIKYLPIREVQCILESPDRKYIDVGTTHGCYRVDKHTYRISRFYYPEEFPKNDYNFFVNSMVYQDAHHIWVGTDGGGLYLYDFKTHAIKQFTTSQSLPSNNVYALLKTPNGRVWMGTDKGLAFIKDGKVTNLSFFKGLECEYKRMSVASTLDGRIFFGSSNGAVVLAPRFAKGLHYVAPLHILGVEVEGKKLTDGWNLHLFEMLQVGNLRFSHDENTVVISFESINYQYQHDIQYQYYLEGYDRQWSGLSAVQEARFANLSPGTYVFHVKAIGRSNGRILGESSLRIHIAEPWWNSWWAWIVYLCILVSFVYLGWDYYRDRLHRKYYEEKINFFVNTAHNIRTPLSLVLAPLIDLEKDTHLSQKSRSFLEMAQRNGDKLLRMITELLDFQKVEQVKDELHLQEVQLPVLLRQQVDKFQMMASEKRVELTLKVCPELVLQTDLKMTDLIFENLLSNAIKYTLEGGKVSVSAVSADGKYVKISVSDTGIGIPKSEKKHIFQSFFRASNAVNSQEMGSGLGLMLTRQLVQKLRGSLSFESEDGKGTTFMLSLPIADNGKSTDDVNTSLAVEHPVDEASSRGCVTSSDDQESHSDVVADSQSCDTILFVDDNADLRQYIRMAFCDTYHIVDVESGEAALRYLQENGECDMVVSDVMMPGMQGDELCRRIKENKDTSWLPVILLTAKAGRSFMIEGLGLGADDYIAKPFDSAILASKIDSMLKNRRRLSQYYMERSLALVRQQAASEENKLPHHHEIEVCDDKPTETVEEVSSCESSMKLNTQDQVFVDKTTRLVMDNLSDTDFNIDRLCREMAMSRTLFYGRLKTLTGQAPQDFIRLIRLEQAAMYLEQGDSVLDVSVKTGFVNVKYFSTVFKKHFGVSPSKYDGRKL